MADHLKIRYQILAQWVQLPGLSAQTVGEEVQAIEHPLKPEAVAVFSNLVRFWRRHPRQLKPFLDYSRRS